MVLIEIHLSVQFNINKISDNINPTNNTPFPFSQNNIPNYTDR